MTLKGRVLVDYDRCDSHGICAEIAPKVFRIGEDDRLVVLTSDLDDDETMQRVDVAIRSCPKQALTLGRQG